MAEPGPETSGAPIVAAEALPARAAEPATAAMARSEALRGILVEKVMREVLLRLREVTCGEQLAADERVGDLAGRVGAADVCVAVVARDDRAVQGAVGDQRP